MIIVEIMGLGKRTIGLSRFGGVIFVMLNTMTNGTGRNAISKLSLYCTGWFIRRVERRYGSQSMDYHEQPLV